MIKSLTLNQDCLPFLKSCKDKEFDLIIADPPYGINFSSYQRGSSGDKVKKRYTSKGKKDWDTSTPSDEIFEEMIRVSKNQIIWGGNYFEYLAKKETPNLKTIEHFNQYISESSENWIFWYKKNPVPNFADGELAWHSFGKNFQFDYMYYGNINSEKHDRIHPTQKPVALYHWIIKTFNPKNVLDPFLGSGSSRIAADILKVPFTGIERDLDIFKLEEERFKRYKHKYGLFSGFDFLKEEEDRNEINKIDDFFNS